MDEVWTKSTGKMFVVDGGSEWGICRVPGRFSLPIDMYMSSAHFDSAIKEYRQRMINGLAKKGYQLYGHGDWQVEGPLPHVDFSDDVKPDPGYANRPDPRDVDGWARWERAERARTAKKVDNLAVGLQDFRLIGTFRKRMPQARILNRR